MSDRGLKRADPGAMPAPGPTQLNPQEETINRLASEANIPRGVSFALAVAKFGYRVLPFKLVRKRNGRWDKIPLIKNWWNRASNDPEAIRKMWERHPDAYIGIATGRGLLVFDPDGEEGIDTWTSWMAQRNITWTPSMGTISGGLHVYYRTEGTFGNGTNRLRHVDFRSEGGFVAVYSLDDLRPLEDLPVLPEPLAELLRPRTADICSKVSDEEPVAATELHPYAATAIRAELDRLVVLELTGDKGWDDTTFKVACNLIEFANSPWAGYPLEQAHDDLLEHAPTDPDFGPKEHEAKWDSALKKIGDQGRPKPGFSPMDDFSPVAEAANERRSSSWAPLDLNAILDGTYKPTVPTFLSRTDGVCLLYPGLTHSISGESGCGKSWIAQYACAEAIKAGHRVLYLDYESSAQAVVGRFLALGVQPAEIQERLTYVRPDDAPVGADFEALLDEAYAVATVDGVTAALGTSGISGDNLSNSNDAVTQWTRRLPEKVAIRTGAAVLQVDHVTKNPGTRNGHAIGGQAKRASLTGAQYLVEARQPFGRGKPGRLVITVHKDREGFVQGEAVDGLVALVEVTPNEDGTVEMALVPPTPSLTPVEKSDQLLRDICAHVRDHPGCVRGDIEKNVTGDNTRVREQVQWLIDHGYVATAPGARKALHHTLVKDYCPEFEA